MGTHPIFESDFDCLTAKVTEIEATMILTTTQKWIIFCWIDVILLLLVFVIFGFATPGTGIVSQRVLVALLLLMVAFAIVIVAIRRKWSEMRSRNLEFAHCSTENTLVVYAPNSFHSGHTPVAIQMPDNPPTYE